ncbi:hypothetical protein [Fischerella thermalis]|uniref:hypothetical protein n=1 Tax=Fischerella thermalis TaxID=372787 RepID=UPI0011AEF8FA|nr:hypothetical protein [Fischerella thermalis]
MSFGVTEKAGDFSLLNKKLILGVLAVHYTLREALRVLYEKPLTRLRQVLYLCRGSLSTVTHGGNPLFCALSHHRTGSPLRVYIPILCNTDLSDQIATTLLFNQAYVVHLRVDDLD